MEKIEFLRHVKQKAQEIGYTLQEEQLEQFFTYKELLIEWNKKMNLTAIEQEEDIITKHFIDSLSIASYIPDTTKIIDIGTGAGFPGIPLKILKKDLSITLLDSLNKRITFLEEVIRNLSLENIQAVHARAEELAHKEEYREQYDIAVSRAVAPMHTLLEYMLPYVKIGGKCICMKGPNLQEESKDLQNCLETLGGKIEKIEELVLPETEIKRNIMLIKKENKTPEKYPRNPEMPRKTPL